MTEAVARITVNSTLDDALLLFERSKVGALPVVNDGQEVVGILSISDLLTAYKQLFGLGEKGSTLIAVKDDGKPKPLTRLTEALENRKVPFSRLIRDAGEGPGTDAGLIYVRVHTHNLSGVHTALAAAGFNTVNPAS
jgi:acetoin utilization protein AcuB